MCHDTRSTDAPPSLEQERGTDNRDRFSREGSATDLILFRIRDGVPFVPWQWPEGPLLIPHVYTFRLLSQDIIDRIPGDNSYDIESAAGLQKFKTDLRFLRQFTSVFSPATNDKPSVHPDDAERMKDIIERLQLEWAESNNDYINDEATKIPGWTSTSIS
jgi:hypothetical protein